MFSTYHRLQLEGQSHELRVCDYLPLRALKQTQEFLFDVSLFCLIHLVRIYGYIGCPYDIENKPFCHLEEESRVIIGARLMMEDDLNDEPCPDVLSLECNSLMKQQLCMSHQGPSEPGPSGGQHVVDWSVCELQTIPKEIGNKCCRLTDCITVLFRSGRVRGMRVKYKRNS